MARLDKVISNKGFGSRKEVKKLIKNRFVSVNNEIITIDNFQVNFNDVINVEGTTFLYNEFVYIMLNKPSGVISATVDENHTTVLDIIDDKSKGLFPVGRLDMDTEGFCLISNDGKLAHQILSPKNMIPKTYFVVSQYPLSSEDIKLFDDGIILDNNEKCLPAKIIASNDNYELTIFEGKYHQVKRMFEAVNNKVLYLKRVKINQLILDPSLEIGMYKYLNNIDIDLLTK